VKKEYSLKGRSNFRELFKRGKRVRGSNIRMIVLTGNGTRPEIGVVVNKKYGNAVQRNRAKRRIRAICDRFLPSIRNDCSLIISPMEGFKTMSYTDAAQDIAKCFQKAGLLKR